MEAWQNSYQTSLETGEVVANVRWMHIRTKSQCVIRPRVDLRGWLGALVPFVSGPFQINHQNSSVPWLARSTQFGAFGAKAKSGFPFLTLRVPGLRPHPHVSTGSEVLSACLPMSTLEAVQSYQFSWRIVKDPNCVWPGAG